MKRYLTLFAATLLTISLSAATYYASPTGSGNGNSYANPTSFSGGVSKLKNPGDTLYLLGGTYEFTDKFSVNKQGSATKHIVIAGYPGEKAILDFHQVAYGTRGLTIHENTVYLHVCDLSIAWSGKNNLYCEGSYCLFERLDIYGSADTGCQMKKGGNNVIKNVDSHDNFDYKTMSGSTANFGGNADGFADKQFTGAGNHYIGCRAWNNSDDGWDFFQRVSNSNTIIENCICYKNGCPFYDMRNHPRATGVDKSWFDGKVGTTMKDRYGNTITITLAQYPNMGNGNGFKLGGGSTLHNALVHHCLAVANNVKGFDQNSDAGKLYLYNNTAYTNGAGGGSDYGFYNANGCQLYIRNCISFQSQGVNTFHSGVVQVNDHNTWNNGFSVSANDFQSLDTTLILAPRQANGDLPDNAFMRLNTNSALIDAGIDVNLAYNGSAPDLGCYEAPGEGHDPDPHDTIPSVQPDGTHAVAYVTIIGCAEDKALLQHLRNNDSLWIVETDATDNSIDYSSYEVIVLGSKPASSAAGFVPLKGYNKPMVLLKPFLLKSTVWNWGNSVNTSDLSITVSAPEHPLFQGLTITDGQVALFSQANTNAVTAISEWYNTTGFLKLASPVSLSTGTTIADFPAGTNCNGTVLPQRLIMIGVSEYSTTYLTADGKQLIENAILSLLGITMPTGFENHQLPITNYKFVNNGTLFIQVGDAVYDALGRRVR